MEYTNIISRDDFKEYLTKKGYNLDAEGVLDTTHFLTPEDAQDDFLQNAFDNIYNFIGEVAGACYRDAFFEDMSEDVSSSEKATLYKDDLIEAIEQEAIFIYDNGDSTTNASEDDRMHLAPKALNCLYRRIL